VTRSVFGTLGIIALFVAMALGLLASYGAFAEKPLIAFSGQTPPGSEPGGTTTTKQVSQIKQRAIPIGETATTGNLTWTVTDAHKASEIHKPMPPPPMTRSGNFVTVSFTVKNVSEGPVTLTPDMLTLFSNDGHKFSPQSKDNGGWIEADKNILFGEASLIQPGDTKEGEANIELPAGVSVSALQVGDTKQRASSEGYVNLEL
jgi:hypothetical protein